MNIDNWFTGLKEKRDWVLIPILFWLVAHSYSTVFPKGQNETLTNNGLGSPALLMPHRGGFPEIIIVKDLSTNGCRKILEQNGERYSDEQVLKIKKMLHNLCLLDYELFVKMKTAKT